MEKKFWTQIVGLVLIIFAGVYYTKNLSYFGQITIPNTSSNTQINIKIDDTIIKAEIADTLAKRTKGLAGRDKLATDGGMLFVFDKPDIHTFWMKGMKIPLDFIWIRGDSVVDLTTKVQPPLLNQTDSLLPRYQSKEAVDKVLEVSSSFVDKHNIKIGDKLYLVK